MYYDYSSLFFSLEPQYDPPFNGGMHRQKYPLEVESFLRLFQSSTRNAYATLRIQFKEGGYHKQQTRNTRQCTPSFTSQSTLPLQVLPLRL